MLAASHFVTGAATGAACRRARAAVPAAFASHFVLDQIPHSCFNMLPDASGQMLAGALIALGRAVDAAVIVAALVLAWRLTARWAAIAAAVAAFLPDPLNYMPPVSKWFALLPGSWIVPWVHGTFHWDVTRTRPTLGFATQIVVIAAAFFVLVRKGRAEHYKKEA